MSTIDKKHYWHLIDFALSEDLDIIGDITTDSTIKENATSTARLIAKEDGVICGLQIFDEVFHYLDKSLKCDYFFKDGDIVRKGDLVAKIDGNLRAILKGERTALNFIQRLSGISSFAHKLVNLVANTKTEILDTRKTTPGYRYLEKYAVKTGGASNHRIGLFDMFLIKDNHIAGAGGVVEAVNRAVNYRKENGIIAKIEIEVPDLQSFRIALDTVVDIIMLDNMTNEQIEECIKLNNGSKKIEVSGNLTYERVKELSSFGVDYLSLGALTHSVKSLDLSLLVD
ncbi:MAG: carboxylating nicotinate-nucleotide diphosphorylase [Candidatus Delongbacteria bacterium]|nr:carboxylating nicotinate-nucleotide diphosphorylase [Candidatus Delongbacteria bacterium]MBN2836823.1 carboxylating nicotinate-nucleotide diphosphorylase [Candidatus Delongbacteria bacterium]